MESPYAAGQLARALTTASTSEDAGTRQRADARVSAWLSSIEAMASGRVSVGSRAPVRGLPPWVTLQVLRGGFASGRASAGGPLEHDELARIERLGLARSRQALFASYLTDAGLVELGALLESRAYVVQLPEDAALLTVAALVRAGNRSGALELLETLRPFAASLRFMPRHGPAPTQQPDHVHRRSAGEVAASLRRVYSNDKVEAQREALTVWLPLTDRFVDFWCARTGGPDPVWSRADRDEATRLVAAYDTALLEHPRCGKYRQPKQNLPILVAATRAAADGRLDERGLGRARHVVGCIVAKRGTPSDPATTVLRAARAKVAQQPSHRQLAHVAAARLASLRPDEGVADISPLLAPVQPGEASQGLAPRGAVMPPVVGRQVRLCLAATVEQLVAEGVVPSAEVLAELVPAFTAQQVSSAYEQTELGALMGATYRAFRNRRTLLLLDLAKQVQFVELPWVSAAAAHASPHPTADPTLDTTAHPTGQATDERPDDPLRVARRVTALAIDAFPATILPNPLISELTTLFTAAVVPLPLTEELAADIFMGRFARKFLAAAQLAAALLEGSLYERYYGLDYAEIAAIRPPAATPSRPRRWFERLLSRETSTHEVPPTMPPTMPPTVGPTFDEVCKRAIDRGAGSSVARNGMVIERQQVLTTHNLAALVGPGGVTPSTQWDELALKATGHAAELLHLAQTQQRPLSTVKDAAYAWRQAIFFTTMAGADRQADIVDRMQQVPKAGLWPMTEVIAGIAGVAAADAGSDPALHRPFLGWSVGPHWALPTRER